MKGIWKAWVIDPARNQQIDRQTERRHSPPFPPLRLESSPGRVFPMEACCKCSWQVCISSLMLTSKSTTSCVDIVDTTSVYKQVKHMIWHITYLRILSDIYKPYTFNAACPQKRGHVKNHTGAFNPYHPLSVLWTRGLNSLFASVHGNSTNTLTSSLGFTETGCFCCLPRTGWSISSLFHFKSPKIQWERFANLKVWFSLTNLKIPQREHVGRIFFVHHDLIDGIKSRRFALEYKFHVYKNKLRMNTTSTLECRYTSIGITNAETCDVHITPIFRLHQIPLIIQGAKQTLQMAPGFKNIASGWEVKMLCNACDWVMSWDGGFEKAPSNHAWFWNISMNNS